MLNVRRKQTAILLAMLTAILMMFAGCGSSENNTGTTGNANVNSEASSPVSSEEGSAVDTAESYTAL